VIARRLSRVSLRGSRSSAVASRPRLLLADEPTSRLDSADALAVSVRLARESGAAVVCASHDRLVIEQADEQALEGRR
jgi:ABC-type lipoprotein export system ATPase subunit